jgi:hypothetical protein
MDRLDGTGPCQVQEDVPIAELAGSDVLQNARILMAELANGRGKLTATGNFTRSFVATLMERFRCDAGDLAAIREVCRSSMSRISCRRNICTRCSGLPGLAASGKQLSRSRGWAMS